MKPITEVKTLFKAVSTDQRNDQQLCNHTDQSCSDPVAMLEAAFVRLTLNVWVDPTILIEAVAVPIFRDRTAGMLVGSAVDTSEQPDNVSTVPMNRAVPGIHKAVS